jgi:hypothetical protein
MMTSTHRLLLIVLSSVVLVILVGACRSDDDRGGGQSGGESTPVVTGQPQPAAANPGVTAVAAEQPAAGAVYLPLIDNAEPISPGGAVVAQAVVTPTVEPVPALEEPAPTPEAQEEPTPEPTPTPKLMNLADWPPMALQDWPRPANDNGLCIHNIGEAYYHLENLDLQIGRLQEMNMRWTLMLYGDENQIMKAAPKFRDAGIMVVWRKMLRANERYYDWGRDIALLRELGMEPYMQIYNEPGLPVEWSEGYPELPMFLDNLINAVEQVYNAGGYVGLQFVDDEWLLAALREIKARGGEKVFQRMFLIPHPYGLNHPPDYTNDPNGVLGFLHQAELVRQEIGFVPPMIAGEGGWKWNATDDPLYPPIDAARHRDYHMAVFDWFRTGVLSNGEPLPDTLFAFCPWLLSSKLDDSAWFDSFAGDHTPTVDAVKAIPPYVRRFSWE